MSFYHENMRLSRTLEHICCQNNFDFFTIYFEFTVHANAYELGS
jgi:hypothetical protein